MMSGRSTSPPLETLTLDYTIHERGRKTVLGSVQFGCKLMGAGEIKLFVDLELSG